MAFDVSRNCLHQAQVDFFNPAAFTADEMMVVFVFDPPADEIAQLTIFAGGSDQDAILGEIFQNPIDSRQANAFEPPLQPCLHFKWIEERLAFQKKFDDGPHFRGDSVAVLLQSFNIIVSGHG